MDDQKCPIVEDIPVSPDSEKSSESPLSPTLPSEPVQSPSRASIPSLRGPEPPRGAARSPNPLGQLDAARRGIPPRPMPSIAGQAGALNPEILARMKAFSLSRQGAPPGQNAASTGASGNGGSTASAPNSPAGVSSGAIAGGFPGRFAPTARPQPPNWSSAPPVSAASPKSGGLAAKRKKPGLRLSDASQPAGGDNGTSGGSTDDITKTVFEQYADIIDTKSGKLNLKNKVVIHGGGIEFSSGHKIQISLDEIDRLEELGKGNYGTVYKVRHSRPHMRRPGMGISGIVSRPPSESNQSEPKDNLTGIVMAMKEIRIELNAERFKQILMELEVLHRAVSPFIIDFYGAFFQEGAVYICVEYMDGGSVDRLYAKGIPENILRKITLSTVMGLKSLKDDHEIIHRDVKPTNILVNTRGQVKICDFGVSGNLVRSMAKTNIGCQSYMAPERIQCGDALGGGTYSVQSDVWSLGLSIVECALGRYPYPPEISSTILSQLHVSIHSSTRRIHICTDRFFI